MLRPYDRIAERSGRIGLGFLATRGRFCFERMCPPVIGRTIAYKDPHHITAAYAGALDRRIPRHSTPRDRLTSTFPPR
jgi:hypothetical protein